MKLTKSTIILSFFVLGLQFIVFGQYEQLDREWKQYYNEGKGDSALITALSIKYWTLEHQGDTSLNYANSYLSIGKSYKLLKSYDSAKSNFLNFLTIHVAIFI